MENIQRAYLPAAGNDWALPLYDIVTRLMGADRTKHALVAQAALRPTFRALDLGCGTGTLAVMIKRLHPGVSVVGLDPDRKALVRGRKKSAQAGVSIQFDQGFADKLPYPDASFDRVFSSFMFHHLHEQDRVKALSEARRVLAPGGSLHLMDMVRPRGPRPGMVGPLTSLQSTHEGQLPQPGDRPDVKSRV